MTLHKSTVAFSLSRTVCGSTSNAGGKSKAMHIMKNGFLCSVLASQMGNTDDGKMGKDMENK
jgi:hypothetical protein